MPFVSKKQEKWAFATKQPFAQKWAGMTNQANLPASKGTPMVPMHPQMVRAIKQAPKGKLPPGLARYLANKKKGK